MAGRNSLKNLQHEALQSQRSVDFLSKREYRHWIGEEEDEGEPGEEIELIRRDSDRGHLLKSDTHPGVGRSAATHFVRRICGSSCRAVDGDHRGL
ncbi:hypothetical protein KM043_009286 [Ampulex compressa]|nr:hypothetical protein KM043_009286 [Ampulex compressa]